MCLAFMFYYKRKGYKVKPGQHKKLKKENFFKRLFWDAPRRFALDKLTEDPDFFRPQGLIIFTGFQGSGKTSALVRYTLDLQKEYPLSKCISNLGYKYSDAELIDWKQLIDYKNEKKGVIVQLDELQNWFSSKQSKNFPPEMLSVVTQNRKNRRVILGTAQNFYMLAKDIRTQCSEIRECYTFAGCITIVRRILPVCDSAGELVKKRYLGFYFFVHDEILREAYDTYHVIESLSKSGFQPRKQEQIQTQVIELKAAK